MQYKLYNLLFVLTAFSATAQKYDTDFLTKEFHSDRRNALRTLMPDNSCAVFFSAPEQQRANDVNFLYHQDPDFYYLSGLMEANSILIILKTSRTFYDTINTNEILFVQDRNPHQEVWTGRFLGKEGAKKSLGFQFILTNKEFNDLKIDFPSFENVLIKKTPSVLPDESIKPEDLFNLIAQFQLKTNYAKQNVNNNKLNAYMATLREVKQPEELALLRKAINITCDAHLEVMKALLPGIHEYNAAAIVEYVFKKEGSEYVAYPTIAGGGENSCILHYETNRKKLENGNLFLIDAGAEYHGYAADVTRTMPVNGNFSKEEAIIYNIVLEAQEAGIKATTVGAAFRANHEAAVEIIKKELLALGIIKKPEEYKTYFFHGTSHYLGLDVHDAGNYGKLKEGNVVTVEPGIYIPEGSNCDRKWWNIGVRIEDDILVTAVGPEILSKKLPKTIVEIENLMKQDSYFNKIE
ncbi:MAG: aminopeptidase P N-terminal domain-containing protein [Bacteroidia bacterium]